MYNYIYLLESLLKRIFLYLKLMKVIYFTILFLQLILKKY